MDTPDHYLLGMRDSIRVQLELKMHHEKNTITPERSHSCKLSKKPIAMFKILSEQFMALENCGHTHEHTHIQSEYYSPRAHARRALINFDKA